jgi:hypothetical protein
MAREVKSPALLLKEPVPQSSTSALHINNQFLKIP